MRFDFLSTGQKLTDCFSAFPQFCGNCGSSILRRMSGVPDNFQLAINVRIVFSHVAPGRRLLD